MEESFGHTFKEEEKLERRREKYNQMSKEELLARILRAKHKGQYPGEEYPLSDIDSDPSDIDEGNRYANSAGGDQRWTPNETDKNLPKDDGRWGHNFSSGEKDWNHDAAGKSPPKDEFGSGSHTGGDWKDDKNSPQDDWNSGSNAGGGWKGDDVRRSHSSDWKSGSNADGDGGGGSWNDDNNPNDGPPHSGRWDDNKRDGSPEGGSWNKDTKNNSPPRGGGWTDDKKNDGRSRGGGWGGSATGARNQQEHVSDDRELNERGTKLQEAFSSWRKFPPGKWLPGGGKIEYGEGKRLSSSPFLACDCRSRRG